MVKDVLCRQAGLRRIVFRTDIDGSHAPMMARRPKNDIVGAWCPAAHPGRDRAGTPGPGALENGAILWEGACDPV